ncbi:MAG TPA: galactonate dehydratase [Planctomycetaceae bacterium]|jgi:galactonate dehydratase|nr:galactonate dehydratase [Planctomycetaceae bacterium]HCK53362.1 galactonate dehydratase [Planctomycetaceae bacterium]|tara:strand:- start:2062 stop:3318 length:1257 start_codon:yes stop_codon:yes gene_type:complete
MFLASLLGTAGGTAGLCALLADDKDKATRKDPYVGKRRKRRFQPMLGAGEKIRITKLETLKVQPRWLFLKVHTDAGIVGLGEPVVEGRASTVAAAVKQLETYLVGKDPRSVVHHWQAMYRHAFYRGGPVLTSAISGIDMALWDIKGKALGVPVYELLGGPTRSRVRVYAHASTPEAIRARSEEGFTAFKTGVFKHRPARIVETPGFVKRAAKRFEELREAAGDERDIGIDFHGAISPQTAKLLIKALEPYQPMFIEEPVQCQNVDVMADIARGTHLPIATGERIFTKWGFRELLEKGAASILQPDMCHAGGITEVRLIAGMAESYYAAIAPHNPLGPISLAAGIQLAGAIPNFLCQEQVHLGDGYIKQPFKVRDGYIDLPGGPGLGVELDEDALKEKIGHDWRNPQSYDADDGSVVDW